MKLDGKIQLDIPGQAFKYFKSDDKIEDIFDYINSVQIDKEDLPFIDIRLIFDDYVNSDDIKDEEVEERVVQRNKDTLSVFFDIPKEIAFTQKFQERIKSEVPAVLEAIYPGLYNITDIKFTEETPSTIRLNFQIKAKTEDAVKNQDYLEENISYVIKDIINYYQKTNRK